MINANEENQILFIDRYLEDGSEARLLVDGRRLVRRTRAGWPHTGTWEVDPKRFPAACARSPTTPTRRA